MKKKVKWTIAIIVSLIVISIITSNFIYKTSEDLYDFPIPVKAELAQEFDQTKSYNWSRASFENGLPFDYEMMLK